MPTDVDQLRDLVLQLSETVTEQQEKIKKHKLRIRELLEALRGKHLERIDPDQLLLFEIGDIEQMPRKRRRRPRRRGAGNAVAVGG